MHTDYPILLDANVLADAATSDFYLSMSEESRMILPRWSQTILDETRRAMVDRLGWQPTIADSRIGMMAQAFPEAMVSGFDALVAECHNHPDDRHVLAAAIRAPVETIVTFNVRDFRAEYLRPWGIEAVHPDDYANVLADMDMPVVIQVVNRMAGRRGRSFGDEVLRLSRPMPKLARRLGP